MLRIPTFLRDVFERPPEREGRGIWFAKKEIKPEETIESGHEPDSPPEPKGDESDATKPQRDAFRERERDVINSGTEEREAEPAESITGDGGGTREPPEEGISGGEESREEEPRIRIKAEILVEKAKSALETIQKIKAILGNKEFMDKIRETAQKDSKVNDLLTSFKEDAEVLDRAEADIQNLKSDAEDFCLWQDPEQKCPPNTFMEANEDARSRCLQQDSPEKQEIEEQRRNSAYDYIRDPRILNADRDWNATFPKKDKTPIVEELEELAHIDETLEKMDETLTGYDTGLKIYLKQIQQLKEDIEKGGEISPPQQEWGGSSFTLKLIHFVYLAMTVKKIYETWKKEWEYDFERAVGDCAAAISPWVAPDAVTQRLLQEQEAKIREVKETQKKDYEKYSFGDLHKAILTPDSDPAVKMAQLEVAAERGWLYGITEEGSTLTVFGQPLSNFVPRSWSKNPSLIAEYHRKLQSINISGEKKKKEEGASAISRFKGTPQALIDVRNIILVEKDYWKAIGLVKQAFQEKVDIGEIGGSLFATIMECTAIDPLFAKVVRSYPEILKEAGKVSGGYPSPVLFALHTNATALQKLASVVEQKGPLDLNNTTVLRELENEFSDQPMISAYFSIRREILEKGNVRREEIYADDLGKIPAGDIPDAVALNRAIGKIMECQTVTTATGEKIDIAADQYTNYRKTIEAGDPRFVWSLLMRENMDESYGTQNAFWLMKGETIRQLFSVSTDGKVAGKTYAASVVKNLVQRYKDLRALAQQDPQYKKWLESFIQDTRKRFGGTQGPGFAMFTHRNFDNVEQLTFTDKNGTIYGLRDLITAGIITESDLDEWQDATKTPAPATAKLLKEIADNKIPIDPPL